MNITITAAPLPVNWNGNPQQLLEAFIDRIEISVDGTSFVISDTQPQGNQGPWLKDGTQWWVWDVDTSTYIPLDLSASVAEQIFIGDVANGPPDSSRFSLWLQTNGSAVNGLFWFAGGTAGWVTTPKELVNGAVTLAMLSPQAAGALITFDTNKSPLLLLPGGAGTFLQSTGNGLQWASLFTVHGTPTFLGSPITLASGTTSTTGWVTISGLETHGVPATATALILGAKLSVSNSGEGTVQVRPNSGGAVNLLAAATGSSVYANESYNQSIYPFIVNGSVLSVDYQVSNATSHWTIYLVGYIT